MVARINAKREGRNVEKKTKQTGTLQKKKTLNRNN
jgi:hypothetical protein